MIETSLTALKIGFKFLFYLSNLQACGLALSLVLFSTELAGIAPHLRKNMQLWAGLYGVSAVLLVGSLGLPLSYGLGVYDFWIFTDYLSSMGYAAALATQLLACAALFVGDIVAAIAAVFLLGSFVLVGHIGTTFFANALVIHLIVGAMWFAALAPLRQPTLSDDVPPTAIFGRLAQRSGASIVGPRCVLAWSVSNSITSLIQTPYGWVLIGKILRSTDLLWAGAANKLRFVPQIEAGDKTAALQLARTVRIEWWLFVLILAFTAMLTTILSPPQS